MSCQRSQQAQWWTAYVFLLDKHQSSENLSDSQETNGISIQTSRSTVNLDNALGEQFYVSSQSIDSFLEIRPSETETFKIKNLVSLNYVRILHKYNRTK
jgi:hypothetical protein